MNDFYQVSRSKHHDKLIFKGGLLLAHYLPIERETIDIDFLANNIQSDTNGTREILEDIIAIDLNDHFIFSFLKAEILDHPHMEYEGIRTTFTVKFGKMTDKIEVDIAAGDSVKPIEENYSLFIYKGKPIFSGEISLLAYPKETIFAEKLETIISKGDTNSRMKDYHDVLLMIREPDFLDITNLKTDIHNTFNTRGTEQNYQIILPEIRNMQNWWDSHIRRLEPVQHKLNLPLNFNDVVIEINEWSYNNLM